jgi:radical SAM protein with 4Fe4S-binding SPASM domain
VHLVDRVQVSLDGSCPEVHEKIRGRGTFAPTIQGIRNLKKAGMTDITIAFTLTRWNLHDVLNVSALSSGLGVDFSLNRFAPLGRGSLSRDLEVTPLEMLDVFKKLQQQSIKSGKAKLEYIYRQMAQPIRTSCGVGKSYFSVAQDGSIYPCHTLHEPQFLIGNILQKGDIRAMLGSSEVAQRFARLDVDHKEICKDCDVRYFCAGGCPANAYGYSGAIEALDPNCPFYKAVERALLIGWRYDRDLTQNIQKVMSELDREVKFAGRMEDQ